jgi:GAF domain-containing protein
MSLALANRLEELSNADSFGDIGRVLLTSVSDSPTVLARWLLVERDPEGIEWIVMRESWSDDQKPAEPVGTRLRLDDYPWAPFLSRTDPMVVEDVQTDRRSNEAALIAARVAGVRSLVSIPLTSTAGWAGTWLMGRAEPSAFEPSLIRQHMALGRVAALTLDNLRLRSAVRTQLHNERLRAAIAPPLAAPFDTGELLQHTVQSLGRTLGVPRVAVHIGSGWEDANGD